MIRDPSGHPICLSTNSTRPTVTIAQKAVSAIDASVAEAPCSVVMSSCDQLPFIVSQMPYSTAKPANSQNAGGTRARLVLTAVLAEVCSAGA